MDKDFTLGLLLDMIAAALIIIPLVTGIMRGFRRQFLTIIAAAVSLAAAYTASSLLVTPLYDSYFKPGIKTACTEAIDRADPLGYTQEKLAERGIDVSEDELRKRLADSGDAIAESKRLAEDMGLSPEQAAQLAEQISDEVLGSAPKEVRASVPKIMRRMESADLEEDQVIDLFNAAVISPEEGGAYAEENMVRPTAKGLLRTAVFMVVFVIAQLVMTLIFFIMGYDMRAQAYDAADRFGGFGIGIVCAAANLLVLCMLVSSIERSSLGFFNIEELHSMLFLPVFKFLF